MKTKSAIGLMVLLMMFPQIVETIYSPALPYIAKGFDVSMSQAGITLSIYFTAFAVGVMSWGVVADKMGRRPAMLLGLLVYGVAALGAVYAQNFYCLLAMRALSAFSAAVGSVVTQTILRDTYDQEELSKVFSLMGIGIAISPALGLLLGSVLASHYGYYGVFSTLAMLAALLLLLSFRYLRESQPQRRANNTTTTLAKPTMLTLAKRMILDGELWRSALLICGFNVMLFSYYLHGPFLFAQLGFSSMQFGLSGLLLAVATFIGSQFNQHLARRNITATQRVQLAAGIALLGGVGVYLNGQSVWFLVPMMLVVIGFSVAIPNILAGALAGYKQQVGSAGALFGLGYYLLIGCGMALAGKSANLGAILMFSAVITLLVSCLNRSKNRSSIM
ncbi:Bcr/CflA family efflux MFS transporter [Vibrio ponticus]|uniref:Bcr/CflA family efflux transporter n=1 Tax=Vibrio ponticus TaxID=265668 RepID=A0A3N3DUK6_9VIBR|nr:multidrug effflux MFS transporter [Vibrio ponticus]ROV58122.1 Bcr/CflA family efflux MFS transporter [Vibrio ponticus]